MDVVGGRSATIFRFCGPKAPRGVDSYGHLTRKSPHPAQVCTFRKQITDDEVFCEQITDDEAGYGTKEDLFITTQLFLGWSERSQI